MTENPFPDIRWGRDPGRRARRAIGAVAGSRPGAWFIRQCTPLDRWLLARSGGRFTILGPMAVPLLLLTTTGRKSGQRRQIPLAYMREGDRLFLVGSNFGQANHPAWVLNLVSDPNAWVTMGGKEFPVLATEVVGEERDRIYQEFVDYISNYDTYRGRSGREIKIFALTSR
jgi:deazaflavin-dependent oxidoreductase (nitroreductase family)